MAWLYMQSIICYIHVGRLIMRHDTHLIMMLKDDLGLLISSQCTYGDMSGATLVLGRDGCEVFYVVQVHHL